MIIIDGKSLTIKKLIEIARGKNLVKLSDTTREAVKKSRNVIEKKLKSGEVVYGVTTGFGELSNIKIPLSKVKQLQINLIRSHSAGVGSFLDEETVRAMLVLRINTLARGYSGIRLPVLETMIKILNKNILPLIPAQGSVGASGDLAPLAHLALGLIGEGEVLYKTKRYPAKKALALEHINPIELEAKEGLALINGTQYMNAIGALVVHDAENIARHGDIAAAMSTDALLGTIDHTDPRIHELRPYEGQKNAAANIRKLMKGSKILASHHDCKKVQDAYSMRCAPQVHGASRDTIEYAKKILELEMNAVTDNPLVFPEDDSILNGGNFHGQPLALALDFLGIALAELGSIAERRIARLIDQKLSECLPLFLTTEGGLNSGMMVIQYTAAALASENKVLAHPASVDSIPTSAGKEDHVSMGSIAARKCREILQNTTNIIGIELICAAQGIDFHRPLLSSKGLESAHQTIREVIPVLDQDRIMHNDLLKIKKLIENRSIVNHVEKMIGSLA